MCKQTELQKVSAETMRFLRGNYALDEIGNGKDELSIYHDGKLLLTISIREDRYDFQVILTQAECQLFEMQRKDFSQKIQESYDLSKTHHNEKWLLLSVADLPTLEAVKQLIRMKEIPNRKPFPQEQAVYSSCGQRCDLCVHYTGGTISEKFRAELKERLIRVYAGGIDTNGYWGDDMQFCDGCHTGGLDKSFRCESLSCAAENGVTTCQKCRKHPCDKAHHFYQGLKPVIHTNTIFADDVTWTILPYVYKQYGN